MKSIILKIKIVLQISDEISVQLIAALGFKWNRVWPLNFCTILKSVSKVLSLRL